MISGNKQARKIKGFWHCLTGRALRPRPACARPGCSPWCPWWRVSARADYLGVDGSCVGSDPVTDWLRVCTCVLCVCACMCCVCGGGVGVAVIPSQTGCGVCVCVSVCMGCVCVCLLCVCVYLSACLCAWGKWVGVCVCLPVCVCTPSCYLAWLMHT